MTPIQPIYGRKGMVVSGHPLASVAGFGALANGGSVVDAAVASAAVLAVVLPQACTIGGDAFILIHAGGETVGLNGSGFSPALAAYDRFAGGIPQRGPLSCSAPGVVAAWAEAHRRFGRLPWDRVLAPAVAYAKDGFPSSPGLARASAGNRDLLAADEGCRDLFLPGGYPLSAGQVLRQEALAGTLEAIAADGPRAFYKGVAAERLAARVEALGGLLRRQDFAAVATEWVDPLAAAYRGYTVRVMPPNSYGTFMLLQLQALARWEARAEEGERLRRRIEAARAAFAVGDRYVADPRFASPVAELLGSGATVEPRHSGKGPANRGGTAVVSVADAEGNGITLVQSVFLPFGSGVLDPATGVLLNNRMIGFNTQAGHPNAVGPGKRPAHTLNPTMAFDETKGLRYLLGTPGGPGQTVTLTQVFSNIVDLGMDPWSAVHAPRWSWDLGGEAMLEPPLGAAAEYLRQHGVAVTVTAGNTPFFGSAEVIERRPDGVLCGVADHRREAYAIGW